MFYFRNHVCRFVILFEGRTGSTYLIQSLDTHPKVRAYGEKLVGLKKDGSNAQLEWAQKVLTPPVLDRCGAIGFKTKLRDIIDPTAFAALLKQMQVRIIHMERRNRIKAVISTINSCQLKKATSKYNLYRKEDRLPASTIDMNDFEWELKFREKLDAKLETYVKNLKLPTLRLCYEDLLTDERETLERIYNFLQVPFRLTRGNTLKNTNDDLRKAVTNLDQIRSYYTGTPYENMFDEIITYTKTS